MTLLVISLIISICMAIGFIWWQYKEYKNNSNKINEFERFFSRKEDYIAYETCDFDGNGNINTATKHFEIGNVANDDAELKSLIIDINGYIRKSKGTVAFSIIQNKTERRITMLYEEATSKLSFPTHIGLMGTFAGVFLGLIMFLTGTWMAGEITDSNIQSLILGVLVSMITSFCGIGLLIRSHKKASEATNQIGRDKNDFYEWVQNELMPSVDVSMVEAIGKLHETIDNFEPSFSRVISQFKNAFRDVTGAFGTDFKNSVTVVANAVKTMGSNMNEMNKNVSLQKVLLDTIKSNELTDGMDAFVEASKRFSAITESLNQFERARRIMLLAAQETLNIQKSFNEQLQVPKQIASDINVILNRINKFEENINRLGVNISQTHLVGNKLVEQIQENIRAIKGKQKVAENYADTANKRLEKYFDEQKTELSDIMQKYNKAFESYISDYEEMIRNRKSELEKRTREFTEAIDQKLSLEEIRKDFSSLKKLDEISKQLKQISSSNTSGQNLSKVLEDICNELNAINTANKEEKKGFLGIWKK